MVYDRRVQDRLNRLRYEHELTCPPKPRVTVGPLPGYGPAPDVAPLRAGLIVLLVTGLALAAGYCAPVPAQMTRSAQGVYHALTLRVLAPDTETFLPHAPDGWVRVTEADALRPDVLFDLAAHWPDGQAGLERHPGFDVLLAHIDMCIDADTTPPSRSPNTSIALYLHPNGSTLRAEIELRPPAYALGSVHQHGSWITSLALEKAHALDTRAHLQWLTLGGVPALQRVGAGGVSALVPFASQGSVQASLPLSHRVILHIDGHAPSTAVDGLARTARDALWAPHSARSDRVSTGSDRV